MVNHYLPPSTRYLRKSAAEGYINNQKSVNTTKKTRTDMKTLLPYMKSISMGNESIESVPASYLDHLLSTFFMNIRITK